MTAETIRTLLHAAPFSPFWVQLANGKKLTVPHPDCALLTQGGRTLIVHSSDEDFEIADVMLATNLGMEKGPARRKRSTHR